VPAFAEKTMNEKNDPETTIDRAEDEYNKILEKDFREQLMRKSIKLTEEELEERIKLFLKKHCICTIATCSNNVPRSTIVRYRSSELNIYILTEGGGKIRNIRQNPLVSVSVCGAYAGFQSVACLQVWGRAEIISPNNGTLYARAYQSMNLEERQDLKGLHVEQIRSKLYIIKISIDRARYLNFPEGVLNQVLIVQRE
jgi:nitroimidazol reductase NimA-like FMN-containing flavoprotein (pyridoxamine 5'-phosphate oxidase superfamily)